MSHAAGRQQRWIRKVDADDPLPVREHVRRIAKEATKTGGPKLNGEQRRMVHAAHEQLARDRKRKTEKRRRRATVKARRANR